MTLELTDEVRSFLRERRFGVLATINADGTPQQSAIWYELDGDQILMNTRRGRLKDRNLLRDPRCSLCIEDEDRYLTLQGRVTLDADQRVAQPDIRRIATRYDGAERAEQRMREQFSREERVTIRMRIERMYGEGFSTAPP